MTYFFNIKPSEFLWIFNQLTQVVHFRAIQNEAFLFLLHGDIPDMWGQLAFYLQNFSLTNASRILKILSHLTKRCGPYFTALVHHASFFLCEHSGSQSITSVHSHICYNELHGPNINARGALKCRGIHAYLVRTVSTVNCKSHPTTVLFSSLSIVHLYCIISKCNH